jgi:hypothetical protein
MTEAQRLVRFWGLVNSGEDRGDLLRRYAAVIVQRPAAWDRASIRAEVQVQGPPLECFCCRHRGRAIYWHHVIQVQYGGSNHGLNLVGLCGLCHASVHPWLPKQARPRGLTRVRDLMAPILDRLMRAWDRNAQHAHTRASKRED